MTTDRRFGDLGPFLRHLGDVGFRPRLVLDVGAHRGDWSRLAAEVFPDAKFLLIEPQIELSEALDVLCGGDDRFDWIQVAAGPRDEVRHLTIWDDLQGSSFLPELEPDRVRAGEQRPVRTRPIDDLLAERDLPAPELVKLDVQGYELEALRGAGGLFGKTELFVLETSLFEFLPGLPLLREVVEFMAERGYEIYDLPGYIWRPVDGALGQIDVAFARRRGVLRGHDRW